MNDARRHRALWGGAIVFGTIMIGAPALAHRAQSDATRRQLLGSWQLVSWEERDASGRVSHPLGPQAIGQLSYTPDGRMSAQLMRPGSRRFASEDWRKAAPLEKSNAWSDYFGYFGTFSIDLEKKAVVHHIEGSWFPNLIGTDQIRYFRLQDDRLILDADTEWGKVHIVWRKVATR